MHSTAAAILARVSAVTGVPVSAITGPRRTRRVAYARFLAIAAFRQAFPWWTFAELAEAAGKKDHCTGVNSLARYQELIAMEPTFAAMSVEILGTIAPAMAPPVALAAAKPRSAYVTRRQFSHRSLSIHSPA